MTLYSRQKKRHRYKEQTFEFCGRRRGWDDLREEHWNMYIILCEIDCQSRFDAWDKVLRAGALGWPWGMQFSFQSQRKKECSNYCTIALISHASKVMLKILQARLQQYVNRELPDVQSGFRKGRGTRDQIANIRWSLKKEESSRKTSALLTRPKPLIVWIITNCGKFFKRLEYQTT